MHFVRLNQIRNFLHLKTESDWLHFRWWSRNLVRSSTCLPWLLQSRVRPTDSCMEQRKLRSLGWPSLWRLTLLRTESEWMQFVQGLSTLVSWFTIPMPTIQDDTISSLWTYFLMSAASWQGRVNSAPDPVQGMWLDFLVNWYGVTLHLGTVVIRFKALGPPPTISALNQVTSVLAFKHVKLSFRPLIALWQQCAPESRRWSFFCVM